MRISLVHAAEESSTADMSALVGGLVRVHPCVVMRGLGGGLRFWSSAAAQLGSTEVVSIAAAAGAPVSSPGAPGLSDLPACRGLPVLGVLPQLLKTPLHVLLDAEQKQNWRDLFSVHLGFGNHAVVVSHPRWIETVYRSEGQYPSRGPTLGLLAEATQECVGSGILAGV